ncbi:Lrp/AsnC family transcriptional regulator [Amaricoccus solimangrovi]|uniref:Lrp/AsnC family transcriptional regulator n=1 Tax=Amaricoccus solimangrovi TaxID=2589815 RepID=A0A501WZR2_9RHOB|nr:Lrp/AsnC family transcriptional regulator [Amaricoccus solimangrovi]TPE53277.1 Lrp/AsnC family transcriptional regulator [Amaricoccus solimangrovi]
MIDEADRRILREIQRSPEIPTRELAERVGLSHTPCWRRLQRMRDDGVITERRHVVDHDAAGFAVTVFCFVTLKEHRRERLTEFEEAALKVPEIIQCFSISGEYDYILQVIARSVSDYERTVKDAIVELPNIASINTSFTLRKVKASLDVPV